MPKTPIDYSKCCIYKIEHIENDNLVYVGHTTNWDKRKTAHKRIIVLRLFAPISLQKVQPLFPNICY